jgi:uncharacterized SAM-dependent methyltransferase
MRTSTSQSFRTTHNIDRSNAPARSFLISREKQTVTIKALDRSFDLEQWEAIFMEISQKYTHAMIEELGVGKRIRDRDGVLRR